MKKVATEELQNMLMEKGANKERADQAEKKQKTSKEQDKEPKGEEEQEQEILLERLKNAAAAERKERKKEEQARNWGLTPGDLHKLLPGRGELKDEFTIEFHPVLQYFRVRFPRAPTRIIVIFPCQINGSMVFEDIPQSEIEMCQIMEDQF